MANYKELDWVSVDIDTTDAPGVEALLETTKGRCMGVRLVTAREEKGTREERTCKALQILQAYCKQHEDVYVCGLSVDVPLTFYALYNALTSHAPYQHLVLVSALVFSGVRTKNPLRLKERTRLENILVLDLNCVISKTPDDNQSTLLNFLLQPPKPDDTTSSALCLFPGLEHLRYTSLYPHVGPITSQAKPSPPDSPNGQGVPIIRIPQHTIVRGAGLHLTPAVVRTLRAHESKRNNIVAVPISGMRT